MPDTRLIERWMPIAALGEESVRERRSMTALPPTYYLHVWWARRPLVASRAAILASLLPADADREKFLHVLGIHGDPVAAKRKIDARCQEKQASALKPTGIQLPASLQVTCAGSTDEKHWLIDSLSGSSLGYLTRFWIQQPEVEVFPSRWFGSALKHAANDLEPGRSSDSDAC